jgi:transposase
MNLPKLALRMPDEVWALFEPILPPVVYSGTGRKPCSNHACLQGLLYVLITGIGWDYVPPCFPCADTIQQRARFFRYAVAHQAAREGYSVLYARVPRLLTELDLARADGRYPKLMKALAKAELLVLDDLAMAPMTDAHRRDLLEIIDDRYQRRSTIVTSQIPIKQWHTAIGDPTLADAILDRLVHNAYKLVLSGKTMRKNDNLTHAQAPE